MVNSDVDRERGTLTRHLIVVIPVGHLIMVHPVITGIAVHALAFMHAMLSGCAMRIGFVMIVILRERATGKREGKESKRDKFRFHSCYLRRFGKDVHEHPSG